MASMTRPLAASAPPQLILLDRPTRPAEGPGDSMVIVAPLVEWARAVHRGNPTAAAVYRHLLDPLDGDPTWEDAEWR